MRDAHFVRAEKKFDTPILLLNGVRYYPIADFAFLVNKTVVAIRWLFENGNSIRKLRGIRIGRSIYIEEDELYIFPFIPGGRPEIVKTVSHYDDDHHCIPCIECTEGRRCPLVDEDGYFIYSESKHGK